MNSGDKDSDELPSGMSPFDDTPRDRRSGESGNGASQRASCELHFLRALMRMRSGSGHEPSG